MKNEEFHFYDSSSCIACKNFATSKFFLPPWIFYHATPKHFWAPYNIFCHPILNKCLPPQPKKMFCLLIPQINFAFCHPPSPNYFCHPSRLNVITLPIQTFFTTTPRKKFATPPKMFCQPTTSQDFRVQCSILLHFHTYFLCMCKNYQKHLQFPKL